MNSTKKASTSKTTTVAAAFPAKTAAAKPPTVVASGKRGFAALAEGVPGLRSAAPAKTTRKASKAELKVDATKPSKKAVAPRSAAAKRAEPAPAKKVAAKAAKPATAPAAAPKKGEPTKHVVKNVAGLIKFLSTMPSAGSYDVERKFGVPTIQVKNIRGRVIAEVQQLGKVAK